MNTSSSSVETLIADGYAALCAGDRERSFRLLAEAVRNDPHNERAWLVLAGAVTKTEERRACLERVLRLNPHNAAAQRGLASLAPTPSPVSTPLPAPTPPRPAPTPVVPDNPPPTRAPAIEPRVETVRLAAPAPTVEPAIAAPAPERSSFVLPSAASSAPRPLDLNQLRPGVQVARRSDRLVLWLMLALGVMLVLGSMIYAAAVLLGG